MDVHSESDRRLLARSVEDGVRCGLAAAGYDEYEALHTAVTVGVLMVIYESFDPCVSGH